MKSKLAILSVILCSLLTTGCFDRQTTASSNNVSAASSLPAVVQLAPGGTGFVSLSWNAVPGEQSNFIVEGSADGVTYQTVATVPDGTNTAKITSLAVGTAYSFRVRGYSSAGTSAPSSVVTATP